MTQRLRNTANGFMAALVAEGFDGPFRWANHEWEHAFYQAWDNWAPARRSPELFPKLELGGFRTSREARSVLWELKRTSPFHGYRDQPLTRTPMGLTPDEFLDIYGEGATPDEWRSLARDFLGRMEARGSYVRRQD